MNKDKTKSEDYKNKMKKPKCPFCHKTMKNYIPTKGKFKGKVQKYSWYCPCRPNLIMNKL